MTDREVTAATPRPWSTRPHSPTDLRAGRNADVVIASGYTVSALLVGGAVQVTKIGTSVPRQPVALGHSGAHGDRQRSIATVGAARPRADPCSAGLPDPVAACDPLPAEGTQRGHYSEGRYQWPPSLMNRPVARYLVAWASFLLVAFVLFGISAAIGVSPV